MVATYRQGVLARRSLDLSIRPLLADPSPADSSDVKDVVQFGAPGRNVAEIRAGALYYHTGDSGVFQLSVALRNVGGGLAVVQSTQTEPPVMGSVEVTRKFVPVGEQVRVN